MTQLFVRLDNFFVYPTFFLLGVGIIVFALLLALRIIPLSSKWQRTLPQYRLIVIGLIAILAAVPLIPKKTVPQVYTLVLVDVSNSVEDYNFKLSYTYVAELIKKYQTYYEGIDSHIAIMGFADKHRIILPWTPLVPTNEFPQFQFERFRELGLEQTNLNSALIAASNYLKSFAAPTDQKQLVLITDGNDSLYENRLPLSTTRALEGIETDIRVIAKRRKETQVWIDEVTMPTSTRIGEPFEVVVSLKSVLRDELFPKIRLNIYAFENDGSPGEDTKQLLSRKNHIIKLEPSDSVFHKTIPGHGEEILKPGYYLYEILLLSTIGSEVYDRKVSVVKFFPSAEILVVEARENVSKNMSQFMQQLLTRLQLKKSVTSTFSFVKLSQDLAKYDLIILYNIPGIFFTPEVVRILRQYVSSNAGGLIFVGGDSSFDFGEYSKRQELVDLLPVTIGKKLTRLKKGMFTFLLDTSASMAMEGRLDILKQSVIHTIQNIPVNSQSQVIAYIFDAEVQKIFDNVLDTNQKQHLIAKIQSLTADGGTRVLPALKEAIERSNQFLNQERKNVGARIYLLSDGILEDDLNEIRVLLKTADPRIQVPSMTIGRNTPVKTLSFLSQFGGSNAIVSHQNQKIMHFDPGIDSQKKEAVILTNCTPDDPILGNIFQEHPCPAILGFNNIRPKANARSSVRVLSGNNREVGLVSSWSLGKGKVLTLGMDLHGLWSSPLFHDEMAVSVVEQLVMYTRRSEKYSQRYSYLKLRPTSDGRLEVHLDTSLNQIGPLLIQPKEQKEDHTTPWYSLKLEGRGTFQSVLPIQPNVDKLYVSIKDGAGTVIDEGEVPIISKSLKAEQPEQYNFRLLSSLLFETSSSRIGYINERIWINKVFLHQLDKTQLPELIKQYLHSQENRFYVSMKNLYQSIVSIPTNNGGKLLTQENQKVLEEIREYARFHSFEKPTTTTKWVPFYDSKWRILILLVILICFLYSLGLRSNRL